MSFCRIRKLKIPGDVCPKEKGKTLKQWKKRPVVDECANKSKWNAKNLINQSIRVQTHIN